MSFEVREDTPPSERESARRPAARASRRQPPKPKQELVLPVRKAGGREVLPFSLRTEGHGFIVSELSSVLTVRGSGAGAVGRAPSGGLWGFADHFIQGRHHLGVLE